MILTETTACCSTQAHSKYYPHIDGIRTLAIIPVVLFHLLSLLCPGGYAGVDVFFVISGYLITGGIIRDLNQGVFTVGSFYHRRIKRILPAYSFLLFSVLVFTLFWATQGRAKTIGYTAFFSTFFSTNIYFNNAYGYFAPDTRENPLLNLWSLSVEELILIWKLRTERFVKYVLGVVALSSFLASVYGMMEGAQIFVFYMLPTRAWELLAGSLIALMGQPQKAAKWAPALAMTGMVSVFFPYIAYDALSPFPGLAALPSVLGTCLLIRYGSVGIVGRLLDSAPFVGIGKISYSLYLWHWPVIIFWTYMTYGKNQLADYLGMVVLSFAMAYFSWKWIETPVRRNPLWLPKQSLRFATAVLTFLAACSFLIYGTERLDKTFGATITRSNCYQMTSIGHQRYIRELVYADLEKKLPDALRILGKDAGEPSFVIWGNSHAGSLFDAMDSLAKAAGKTGYMFNYRSTPVMGVYFNLGFGNGFQTPEQMEMEMKWLLENPGIKEVFLIARWLPVIPKDAFSSGGGAPRVVSREEKFKCFRSGLMETCGRLGKSGKKVVVFTDVPCYEFSPWDVLEKQKILPTKQDFKFEMSVDEYNNTNADTLAVLDEIARTGLAEVIPIHKAFLRGDHYVTFEGRRVYYQDSNHLSREGAEVVRAFLAPLLWKNEK